MSPAMTYWPVSPPLAPLVDSIYVLRDDAPYRESLAGSLLPQLLWQVAGRFAFRAVDGRQQTLARVAAFGPSTAALRIASWNRTVVVGVGVFPEGWAALMPVPAGSVIERALSLTDLWKGETLPPDDADPDADDEALARRFEALLLRRLAHAQAVDPRVAAISEWANGTEHDIDTLADAVGVSRRQIARITTAAHGLPPRLLANKHKILRMAAVLASGLRDNRREVWTSEYADQPHFIRHFRRFIGTTPTRFLSDEQCLVREVMRARQGIASSHPLGLAPDRVPD